MFTLPRSDRGKTGVTGHFCGLSHGASDRSSDGPDCPWDGRDCCWSEPVLLFELVAMVFLPDLVRPR